MRLLLLPAMPNLLDACTQDQDGFTCVPPYGSQHMQTGLHSLHDLKEALYDMESMVMHNTFIDELLLYKGMKAVKDMLGGWTLRTQSTCTVAQNDSDDGVHAISSASIRAIGGSVAWLLKPDVHLRQSQLLHCFIAMILALQALACQNGLFSIGPTDASCRCTGRSEVQTLQHDAMDVARPDDTKHDIPIASTAVEPITPPCGAGARMQRLWLWKCDLTEGRSVTSMSWNTDRHDLVAVGYGSFAFGNNQDGLVCIWSLRNPNYPLWWFTVDSGVTSLDFSNVTGGVLAIGLYSGNIAVYDIKSRNPEPSISSKGAPGKHHDPVWKIKWTDTGYTASTLVSISTDGRVTRWRITKGLEHNDLMRLKRMQRREAVYNSQRMANIGRNLKQEAFISRLTAGTTFDFSLHDERIYLAGEHIKPDMTIPLHCVCTVTDMNPGQNLTSSFCSY